MGHGIRSWNVPRSFKVLQIWGLCFVIVYVCAIFVPVERFWMAPHSTNYTSKMPHWLSKTDRCPSVLDMMVKGKWIPQNASLMDRVLLSNHISQARGQYHLPKNMQRTDGRCGNVSFHVFPYVPNVLRYFRGTCNPDGANPCCKTGKCVTLPQEECTCDTCYDLRQDIQAELARWKPEDPRCEFREFNSFEVCRLLAGTTILVAGDSTMRQIYIALVLILTGNKRNGAMDDRPTVSDVPSRCSGMHQFTEKSCRRFIKPEVTACFGSVHIKFRPRPKAAHVNHFLEDIRALLSVGRSLVLVGIGIHDGFSSQLVTIKFLEPVMNYLRSVKRYWPQLLWWPVHAFGTLAFAQENDLTVVRHYNRRIGELLTKYNVPIFNTIPMTKGVTSVDGIHYGQGVNLAKAQLFLNYAFEQRLKGLW